MEKIASHTQKQILNIASRLFLEHGYNDTAMNAIFEKIGCSESDILEHYQSREMFACKAVQSLTNYVKDEIIYAVNLLRPDKEKCRNFFMGIIDDILATYPEFAFPILPPQQNLWVSGGSCNAPSW